MSNPEPGAQTRWLASLTSVTNAAIAADPELSLMRSAVLAARADAVRQGQAAMGGSFLMSGAAMRSAYADLHAQYEQVVAMRTALAAHARAVVPAQVGGQITGVVLAAQVARRHAETALLAEIVAVETEIVGVLNGMYGSYHGSAATDAANSAAIRAAGSAES